MGTINLRLEKPLFVLKHDFRTSRIDWGDRDHAPGEIFDFLRVQISKHESEEKINAWLYIAHHSKYRNDPWTHEIVSPFLALPPDGKLYLFVNKAAVEIPYRECPLVVV